MSEDSIRLQRAGGVATLSFNRPDALNALDAPMMRRFRSLAESLQEDPSVRVIVLRGEGRAFLSGGDLRFFHEHLDDLPGIAVRDGRDMHFGLLALRRAHAPVLASVHGACVGAGIGFLCAADLAIAAEGTRFSLAYASIGASPDGGTSWFLPRLLGYRRAMEMVLLPDFFDAARALELGLVNRVVPAAELAARTEELAARLAAGPSQAYREAKRLLADSGSRSLETQMEEELAAFARCARSADVAEGLAAFLARRTPRFEGR